MEKKKNTFESDLDRLDQIVQTLEGGDCPLEESLKLYEEGVELVRRCSDRLEKAEMSVKKLQFTQDGKAVLAEFDPKEDAE